jgi:hypothetical protein
MYDTCVKPFAAGCRRLTQDKAEAHIESPTLCAQPSGAAFLPTTDPGVFDVNVQIRYRPIEHRQTLSRDWYSTLAQASCNIRQFHPLISLQLRRHPGSAYVND